MKANETQIEARRMQHLMRKFKIKPARIREWDQETMRILPARIYALKAIGKCTDENLSVLTPVIMETARRLGWTG